jgi:hypothetical protein
MTPAFSSRFCENPQLVDRIVKAGGLLGNAKLAPWVAHSMYKWAGADYVEKEFLAGLPGVVRFLFDHFWWVTAVQLLDFWSAICMKRVYFFLGYF